MDWDTLPDRLIDWHAEHITVLKFQRVGELWGFTIHSRGASGWAEVLHVCRTKKLDGLLPCYLLELYADYLRALEALRFIEEYRMTDEERDSYVMRLGEDAPFWEYDNASADASARDFITFMTEDES